MSDKALVMLLMSDEAPVISVSICRCCWCHSKTSLESTM